MIRIPGEMLAAIRTHARDAYPHECCGVLVGRADADAPASKIVVRAARVENAREDERERRYLIPPDAVREIDAEARRDALEIVGFYHSHPDHPAEPSAFDREHAWPWYTYLIVAVRRGSADAARAWCLADDRESFEEESITLEEDS